MYNNPIIMYMYTYLHTHQHVHCHSLVSYTRHLYVQLSKLSIYLRCKKSKKLLLLNVCYLSGIIYQGRLHIQLSILIYMHYEQGEMRDGEVVGFKYYK